MSDVWAARTDTSWLCVARCRYSYRNCRMFTSSPVCMGVVFSLLVITWRRICFTVSIIFTSDKACGDRRGDQLKVKKGMKKEKDEAKKLGKEDKMKGRKPRTK